MENKTIRFIDLFAGLGGIRLGFEQACEESGLKAECVLTSEIKEHAIEALKDNFEHKNFVGDITKVDTKDIPDFDILLGGFPCQAFSTAGNRLGFADTRGTLFFEVERILKEKKPKGFILENVEGLITHDKENKTDPIGRTLKTILQHLEALGYKVNWRLLNCKDFGVPQDRKRIFITGMLKEKVNMDNFDKTETKIKDILEVGKPTIDSEFTRLLLRYYTPEELKGKAIKDKRGGKNNIHSWDICYRGEISEREKTLMNTLLKIRRYHKWADEIGIKWMDGMPLTENQIREYLDYPELHDDLEHLKTLKYLKLEYPKKEVIIQNPDGSSKAIREYDETKEKGYNIIAGKLTFEFSKILDPESIAPTLVAMDVHTLGVIDGEGIRTLTIREGLRMFGFPKSYNLSMFEDTPRDLSKAFDLLGNTVAVPAVKAVALRVCEVLKKGD